MGMQMNQLMASKLKQRVEEPPPTQAPPDPMGAPAPTTQAPEMGKPAAGAPLDFGATKPMARSADPTTQVNSLGGEGEPEPAPEPQAEVAPAPEQPQSMTQAPEGPQPQGPSDRVDWGQTRESQDVAREDFKNKWMGTGQDRGAQDALIRQHGLTLDGAGRARLPNGEIIDLRLGARAGGITPTWTGAGGSKFGQDGGPQSVGGGGGGPGGPGGGGGGGGDFSGDVRGSILDMLRSSRQPINTDELNASPEAQAYRRTAEREMMKNRAQMAESASARGGGVNAAGEQSGAMQSGIGQGQEALAERMQGMQSQMVGREMQNRRQQLMQAMQLGAGVMGRDQQLAMQRELGNLDAQIRREGYGSQERMAGQQTGLGYDQLDWQQRRFGMGGG